MPARPDAAASIPKLALAAAGRIRQVLTGPPRTLHTWLLAGHRRWLGLTAVWLLLVVVPDFLIRLGGPSARYALAMTGSWLLWVAVLASVVRLRALARPLGAVAALLGGCVLLLSVAGALGYFRFFKKDLLSLEWEFVLENPRWAFLLASDALSFTQALLLLVATLGLAAVLYSLAAPAPAAAAPSPLRRWLPLVGIPTAVAVASVITWYVRPLTADLIAIRAMALGTLAHVRPGAQAATLPPPQRAVLPTRTPAHAPDVLLIVNESLGRSEAFGARQMPQVLAFLGRHPDRALSFPHAVSMATATTVSIPTILSGLESQAPRQDFARAPLVWHTARAHGYATALFSAQEFSIDFFSQYFLGADRPDVAMTAPDYARPPVRVNELGVDDRLAVDAALAYVRKAPRDRPYLLVLQLNATHWPCWSPDIGIGRWRESSDDAEGDNETGGGLDPRRCEAATRFVDQQIGRLLAELESSKRLERTLIIGTSDHGEVFRPDRPARRHSFHEEVLGIPLWMHLPAELADRMPVASLNAAEPTGNLDIHPTLLDVWGNPPGEAGPAPARPPLTGRSLLSPLPAGRTMVSMTDSSISRETPGFAIYHGRWKWMFSEGTGGRLYDLHADPGETHDLSQQAPPEMLSALHTEATARPELQRAMEDMDPDLLARLKTVAANVTTPAPTP